MRDAGVDDRVMKKTRENNEMLRENMIFAGQPKVAKRAAWRKRQQRRRAGG
jgi:hypothetical protein